MGFCEVTVKPVCLACVAMSVWAASPWLPDARAETIVRRLSSGTAEGISPETDPGVDEAMDEDPWQAAIPPFVESGPVATARGTCFAGGHPVALPAQEPAETQANVSPWHDDPSAHYHVQPPLDLRLFRFDGRCYHFVGDPHDFGHAGEAFNFHGMHPVPQLHGGGWCYFDGAHAHTFQVHSPYMQRIGKRSYWSGGFDSTFRVYYPYFVHFHRNHYPEHYAEGRYLRTRQAAPPSRHVPLPPELLMDPEPPPPAPPVAAAPAPAQATAADHTVIIAAPPVLGYPYAPALGYRHVHGPQRAPPHPAPPNVAGPGQPAPAPPPPRPPPLPRPTPASRGGAAYFVK